MGDKINVMRYIITIFDYSKKPPLPLLTIVYDGNKVSNHVLYMKGTKKKISDIEGEIEIIRQYMSEPCMVVDFKSHINPFGLDKHVKYDVYDPAIDGLSLNGDIKTTYKTILDKMINIKPAQWMKLRANASIVYQSLQDRGVKFFGIKKYPIYGYAYTGRSKTTDFNIQGTTDDDEIRSIYDDRYFVHLDWIAADLRVAALMSNDQVMIKSFDHSDPYTYLSNEYKNEFERDKIKITFLKAFYSLNFDHPIFDMFPTFRRFCIERNEFLSINGYVTSILGRKFYLDDKHNRLSVFNSQFQGSVAHAMNIVLIKLFKCNPMMIFTEVHDSVILTGNQSSTQSLIDTGLDVMYEPTKGLTMPLKASIGTQWRKWEYTAERR